MKKRLPKTPYFVGGRLNNRLNFGRMFNQSIPSRVLPQSIIRIKFGLQIQPPNRTSGLAIEHEDCDCGGEFKQYTQLLPKSIVLTRLGKYMQARQSWVLKASLEKSIGNQIGRCTKFTGKTLTDESKYQAWLLMVCCNQTNNLLGQGFGSVDYWQQSKTRLCHSTGRSRSCSIWTEKIYKDIWKRLPKNPFFLIDVWICYKFCRRVLQMSTVVTRIVFCFVA